MNFNDILKKSFLEGVMSTDISTSNIVVTLSVTLAIGIYIFGLYRVATRKAFYSKSFNISLVALAVITAAIILAIQSSVVISLGMVGALSIVRFRTAIKEPLDLVFLFWSISVGIICGAHMFELAVIASVAVTVIVIALELLPARKESLLLIVNAQDPDIEEQLKAILDRHTKYWHVKSRNLTMDGMDMIVELRTKEGSGLIKSVGSIEKVTSVSLLSHDGEVTY